MPEVQRELRNMLRWMFEGVKIDSDSLEETMLSELLADGSIKGEKEFQTKKQYYLVFGS